MSNWTLEVRKYEKGEDEIPGTLAASITPRTKVDEMSIAFAPKRHSRQAITMSMPTVGLDKTELVVTFDIVARINERVQPIARSCGSLRN